MSLNLTHHEALIYVMVTMSAVDQSMDETELLRIGDQVKILPVFKDFNPDDLVRVATVCGDILREDDGLIAVLDAVADALPLHLYDTAYALAVEVAAADLHIEQEELRFLQMLRDRLDLDKLSIAAIEYGAKVRHRLP
ncbi:MAG: tellurite resistance TerB family protein [Pseudomonadota bacterium]